MANVKLTIGGQTYTLACGDGQESNLTALAAKLDEKVSFIRSRMPASETMGLVMGALLLASDLTDEKNALEKQKKESDLSPEVLSQTVQLIEKVSNRISGVAETIENA